MCAVAGNVESVMALLRAGANPFTRDTVSTNSGLVQNQFLRARTYPIFADGLESRHADRLHVAGSRGPSWTSCGAGKYVAFGYAA